MELHMKIMFLQPISLSTSLRNLTVFENVKYITLKREVPRETGSQ